jgi:hypothetical protein
VPEDDPVAALFSEKRGPQNPTTAPDSVSAARAREATRLERARAIVTAAREEFVRGEDESAESMLERAGNMLPTIGMKQSFYTTRIASDITAGMSHALFLIGDVQAGGWSRSGWCGSSSGRVGLK